MEKRRWEESREPQRRGVEETRGKESGEEKSEDEMKEMIAQAGRDEEPKIDETGVQTGGEKWKKEK